MGVQDRNVLIDGYCQGCRRLVTVSATMLLGRGHDGRSGCRCMERRIGDGGADLSVAAGDAIHLQGDAGVGGSGDGEGEANGIGDADIGILPGLDGEDDLAGPTGR